jgi:hypothetical protein
MSRAVESLRYVGQLFGILMASSDLDRYEQNLGLPLPPGYRLDRLAARIRAALVTEAMDTLDPRHLEQLGAPTSHGQ